MKTCFLFLGPNWWLGSITLSSPALFFFFKVERVTLMLPIRVYDLPMDLLARLSAGLFSLYCLELF